jgi:RNA polymerase sigma-70 factor, ECF subfamily
MAPKADDTLVRAAAGDGAAFEALIGPLIEPAYRLALAMLGRPPDARDVVQDATLRAWRHIDRVRRRESLRSWYMAIVVNQCRSWRRARWWTVLTLPEVRGSQDRDDWVDVDLREAVRALSPSDRAAIYLHFYLDLTVEEVATSIGISPAAARSRIYRAVGRIRSRLGQEVG